MISESQQCTTIVGSYWNSGEVEDSHYFHLLEKNKKYYGKEKTFDQQYVHNENSETYLVEFLKNLQKGAKQMFTGIDFEKAIDYYRKGKEVIVLDRASVGKNGKSGYDTFPFEELFKDLDFLVDVPAVINPDFEQAVQGMTEADQVDSEEIIQAVHETQGSITPPQRSRRKGWKKKR